MLQRVMLEGIELPRLYIAENREDVAIARDKGIPYVCWTHGTEALIRMLLRPTLERMFPHIKWDKVLGPKHGFRTKVIIVKHDDDDYEERIDDNVATDKVAVPSDDDGKAVETGIEADDDGITEELSVESSGTRTFGNVNKKPMVSVERLRIEDYVGDMNSYVNIDVLQRLKLMPKFIGDILDCIKVNATAHVHWSEGYNKKLGCTVGNFDRAGQLPNLIILDVSGSIPRGISATMISLIDTLRTQLSADLIITSSNSRFYPMGSELPSPQTIRNKFGYGNESYDFFAILTEHVQGKHYGHVFSFGDNDTPMYSLFNDMPHKYSLSGCKVEHVHHYHTGKWMDGLDGRTGYAKWCHLLSTQPEVEYDTSWCTVINDR